MVGYANDGLFVYCLIARADANDGLFVYCLIARAGQKWTNILRDPRVSIAIAKDYPDPMQIKGLSMAARAAEVTDADERQRVAAIFLERYPEYKTMPSPAAGEMPLVRFTPELVSISRLLERLRAYRPGSDHRHQSSPKSSTRRVSIGLWSRRISVYVSCAAALTGVPRRNSSACIGCLPAR
ncbi:MAG: hypothetical protein WDN48_09660 [Pseudolabrys sp.]